MLQGANCNLDRDACILSITLFNYSNALNTTQPLLLKKKLLEIPPNSSTIPWIIADLACTVSQTEQRSVWLGDVQNRNSMRDHVISTPVYLVPPQTFSTTLGHSTNTLKIRQLSDVSVMGKRKTTVQWMVLWGKSTTIRASTSSMCALKKKKLLYYSGA